MTRPVCSLIVLLLALLSGWVLIASGGGSHTKMHRGTRSSIVSSEGMSSDVIAWREVNELPRPIAQFATVFWEAEDTVSLRQWIQRSEWVRDKHVLEIGTGTGLLSLCCLQAGARRVVATDVNPAALASARFNARRLGFDERLETRLVSPSAPQAFAVVGSDRFDLILSNPPWEDGRPKRVEEAAFYDPNYVLLESLVAGLDAHLRPGGKALLAYGHTPAIRHLLREAKRHGLRARIIDERRLDELPTSFLPGMLIELSRKEAAENRPARSTVRER